MRLTSLPTEILLEILPHLNLQELLRCRQVSQAFKGIIDGDVRAQYKIELAAAGMEDGPPSILTPSDRLSILRARQSAWNKLQWNNKTEIDMLQGALWELYGGVLAQAASDRTLILRQLPSVFRGIEDKEWSIPDVGVNMRDFGMDPTQDLLIVIEESQEGSEDTCRVHLKLLSTGAPHPAAQSSSGILSFKKEAGHSSYIIQTSEDYLGVMTSSLQEHVCELLIWNWKTASLRLHIEGAESPSFAFLNSRYLLVAVLPFPTADEDRIVFQENPYMLVLDLDTYPAPAPDEVVFFSDMEYVCSFHYPRTSDSFTAFSMTVRSDPGPCWRPHPSHKVPFFVSREDRLLVVTIWLVTVSNNIHQHLAMLSLFPASTLLNAVASLPPDAHKHKFAWDDWGPSGSRLLPAPPTQTSTWVCYVYGMVFTMAIRQGSQKIIVTLDFNQLALRRGADDDGGGQMSAPMFPRGVFQQEVRTTLPYRSRKMRPFGAGGAEGEGHFDAVMIGEDSLIMVSSQSHIRKYRILTF